MGQRGRRAEPGDGLAVEQRELNTRIMQAFKDAEESRLRLLGALAILLPGSSRRMPDERATAIGARISGGGGRPEICPSYRP